MPEKVVSVRARRTNKSGSVSVSASRVKTAGGGVIKTRRITKVARSPQSATKSRRARATVMALKAESPSSLGRKALAKPGRSRTVRAVAIRSSSAKKQASSRKSLASRRMSSY